MHSPCYSCYCCYTSSIVPVQSSPSIAPNFVNAGDAVAVVGVSVGDGVGDAAVSV